MVDHHAATRRQQRGQDLGQTRGLQMDFHMPAQRIHAGQQGLPRGGVQRGGGQANQIQADTHHAGVGQRL
ncbi:hypothetical protein D3C72_2303680 [compost metagenome]